MKLTSEISFILIQMRAIFSFGIEHYLLETYSKMINRCMKPMKYIITHRVMYLNFKTKILE
jgi:hypothetical protein